MSSGDLRVGIDVGGTFTDVILEGGGTSRALKLPSTPPDFERAVLDGLRAASPRDVRRLAHGTTVATNAILEGRGARTGLVTTKGFRDVLELGRLRHPSLSDIYWEKPPPLVPRRLRLELDERIDGRGRVQRAPDDAELERIAAALRDADVESVAIALLNSYLEPAHERIAAERLRAHLPGVSLSVSSALAPEAKEYERTSTAVVNAYVQPLVDRYVARLEREVARMGVRAPLRIMQSYGGLLDSRVARARPVQMVESGPAAGVIAASRLDLGSVIAFDMGGTTAKASLVEDGRPFVAQEYEVGGGMSAGRSLMSGAGYVVRVPSIDIAEVGAGGGSICWIDEGGAPRVGPVSAGAVPGPACYGRGGTEPTLTDAILLLGYLGSSLAGGAQALHGDAAEGALRRVAEPLGLDLLAAAHGMYRIAVAHMSQAVRAVTSQRGRDPRDFALVAFGGAGPAHVVEIAREFGIGTVVVPPRAGVFSAAGLLAAAVEQFDVWSCGTWDPSEIRRGYEAMEARTRPSVPDGSVRRFADLRYSGQSSELRVPVPDGALTGRALRDVRDRFEAEHERTYGHRGDGERVELVNLRLRLRLDEEVGLAGGAPPSAPPRNDRRPAYFEGGLRDTPVLSRADLPRPGPAIVEDDDATTVIPPGATATCDAHGNIVIRT